MSWCEIVPRFLDVAPVGNLPYPSVSFSRVVRTPTSETQLAPAVAFAQIALDRRFEFWEVDSAAFRSGPPLTEIIGSRVPG